VGRAKQSKSVAVVAAITPKEFMEARDSGDREAWVHAVAKLHLLTQEADRGDKAALGQVLAIYQAAPDLWPSENVLDTNIELAIMKRLALPENLHIKKVVEHQREVMRTSLLGPDPTPVDRMLVDRIIVNWLSTQLAELTLQQSDGSVQRLEFLAKRADRAEQRLMRSLKTLATVRRLVGPTIQVNVAEEIKQVNIR
jgi:hypothetical protein